MKKTVAVFPHTQEVKLIDHKEPSQRPDAERIACRGRSFPCANDVGVMYGICMAKEDARGENICYIQS